MFTSTSVTKQTQNRYKQRFDSLKAQGKRAFIPFTLLGWPTSGASLDIIKTMIDAGVSALELGFPFSDPVADGPVIQQAATEALTRGFRVQDGMTQLRAIRALDANIPIGLLVYYNLILAYGVEAFFHDLAQVGVDGVLIPDLPPELMDEVAPFAEANGISLIMIVSPLTSPERLGLVCQYAGGFVYVVSRLGITGVEARYDQDLLGLLDRIRQTTNLPACVGFGVSTPEQAKVMAQLGADGVITGSRVIQLVREAGPARLREVLLPYLQLMVQAINL